MLTHKMQMQMAQANTYVQIQLRGTVHVWLKLHLHQPLKPCLHLYLHGVSLFGKRWKASDQKTFDCEIS